MIKYVVVLDEVPVVRPDPLLQVRREPHLPSQAGTFSRTATGLRTGSGLTNWTPVDPLVEQHVRRVRLLDAEVEELVRHLVVRPRVHLASEALAGDLVWVETLHLGIVEGVPLVFGTATVPENGKL